MSASGTAVKVPLRRDVGENHRCAPGNTESILSQVGSGQHHVNFSEKKQNKNLNLELM